MKTRELLKLNERYSIVEATYEKKDTEYVVCANYNPDAEPYRQWENGAYFTSLEGAVKFAALRRFSPIHRYVLIETDNNNNITEKTFSSYDEAYKEFKERFDNYASDEDCRHAAIVDDGNGNTVGELWFKDDKYNDDIGLKIIDIIV